MSGNTNKVSMLDLDKSLNFPPEALSEGNSLNLFKCRMSRPGQILVVLDIHFMGDCQTLCSYIKPQVNSIRG